MSRRRPDAAPAVALERVATIARQLGDFRSRVVFIGGSIAPLLHTHPTLGRPRPSKDVDAVVATSRTSNISAIDETLRSLGFRSDPIQSGQMHRWISPDETNFDVVAAGTRPGGRDNPWDTVAVEASTRTELEPGLFVRHATATGFLALKFAAFTDRGQDNFWASHDLEDIVALLASRPSLMGELSNDNAKLQLFIASRATAFLAKAGDDLDEIVDWYLARDHTTRALRQHTIDQLYAMTGGNREQGTGNGER